MLESRQGTLIVLEGGEGCGKDANIAALQDRYRDRADVVFTREPGGTEIGERLRELVLHHDSSGMAIEAELMVFLAARAQLMHEVIRPALSAGTHVIANRFALSTVAYQIYRHERHEHLPLLELASKHVVGDVVPHYVLLDVPPEVGLARVAARKGERTRMDDEPIELHARVRQGYHEAVQAYPHTIVDATKPLAEVQEVVAAYVASCIDRYINTV